MDGERKILALYARDGVLYASRAPLRGCVTPTATRVGEVGPVALEQLAWSRLSTGQQDVVRELLGEAAANARMSGAPTVAASYTAIADVLVAGASLEPGQKARGAEERGNG